MRVFAPSYLDFREVLNFCNLLESHVHEEELFIDFQHVKFAKPFGLLYLAFTLRDFARRRKTKNLETKATLEPDQRVISYLAHIGFFRHAGLEYGNLPGEATGSATYLPIHHITRRTLSSILPGDVPIEEAIENEARRLTSLVLRLDRVPLKHPVAYCFREVVRNTFEHANTNTCTLCAQKWDNRGMEIAMFDRGRGIRASLNDKYDLDNDYDALVEAIKPGISGVDFSTQSESYWANSGYGLYVLSELAIQTGGSFFICSGNSALHKNMHSIDRLDYSFSGTCVRLIVNKPSHTNPADLIKQIVEKGESLTGKEPSKASKSTKSVFQLEEIT